ncbi:hypothetical protein KNU13_gp58 [Gordonia phage Turuncu]|uniref:Uncharacterized protein n=1 Tax=Gordonia phage Turuncu TaxID=2315610 RepID=A0A386KA88_9CAUD|nr:hypothetical protein KNU13_gp58 [Gordonia phage Turuncu]AYD82145.1 hypothetical protein SEA_TURUNCU_58 [Gordonia phage Turuncu]
MDIDKVLSELEFQPKGLKCEVRRMLWTTRETNNELPDDLWPSEHHPRGCQNTGSTLYAVRLCPCWNDPRKLIIHSNRSISDYVFADGLLVNQIVLCDAHVSYFRDYLTYPFLCPGCGIHFERPESILVATKDFKEMM